MRHDPPTSARSIAPKPDRSASRRRAVPLATAGALAPLLFAAAALAAGATDHVQPAQETPARDAGSSPVLPLAAPPDLAPLGDGTLADDVPLPVLPADPGDPDLFLPAPPTRPSMEPFLEVPAIAKPDGTRPAGAAPAPDVAAPPPEGPVPLGEPVGSTTLPGAAPLR